MHGLLILPEWFFTPQNVAKQNGYVGWQVGLESWYEKKTIWGEIGEPVKPMQDNDRNPLTLNLAWAAEIPTGGQWQKAEKTTLEVPSDYTGASYENGSAQFNGFDACRFTIVPPGTMEAGSPDEWAQAKSVAQA